MKALLFISVLILVIVKLEAQTIYSQGTTAKGKFASYYCIELLVNHTVRVRNIQNKDTIPIMYFDDGKIVPTDQMLNCGYDFKFSEFIQTFKETLTPQELEQLKNARGTFIVNVVADKAGNTLEIDFMFHKNNPVFSKFIPDRLFQLESKLKKLLKIKIGEEDRKIKNVKYMVVIDFNQDLK